MEDNAERAAALADWIQNVEWTIVANVELESLPAYGRSVFVSDGVKVAFCYRNETDRNGHHWYMDGSDAGTENEFSDVTHYMEGPPPPVSVKYKKQV